MRTKGMGRSIALASLLGLLAAGPVQAQDHATVEGAWDVSMATSVSRSSDGSVEVLEETAMTLHIGSGAEGLVGRLEGSLEGLGRVTIHLEGSLDDEGLHFDPVRVETSGGELPEGFRGFYVDGALDEGELAGEMWSAVVRDGEERHRGPLPWRATRAG